MRQLNARLTVVVAAVAVAAVVGGGVFAYRQGPQASDTSASPLGGQPSQTPTPTPKPSATPSRTPSATPTATPSAPPVTGVPVTGPKKITVNLAKLSEGRPPQLVHTLGRTISGGPEQAYSMPGNARILSAAQVGGWTYALESREPDLVLVRDDGAGGRTEIRDISTLVGSVDDGAVAYASQQQKPNGEELAGSTVYADVGSDRSKLALPDAWHVQVIAVAAGKVFYSAGTSQSGPTRLYTWVPGRSGATLVKGVATPTAVSADGKLAGSIDSIGEAGSCSFVIEIATGKKLWRTCQHMVMGFTPDKSAVIAGPAYADGYASMGSWLLDGKTGKLLREWNGVSFRQVRAEDDQHLLMEVDDGPDTKGAIIRCTIGTGDCERATPIMPNDQFRLGG
ncbi:hypothetical protein ACQPXM_03190 [Kribbella sp. CA-253562]|uniref:hypothetical protein n=1 Tax=Kribbella sp. CA-253562 TaxID=3239942 RepID=UPI003D93AA64